MKHTSVFSALLVGASVAVVTSAAPAHAVNIGVCKTSDVNYNLNGGAIDATACTGELETNSTDWPFNNDVTGSGDPLLSRLNNLFGTNYNWSFVRKDEQNGNQTNVGFDGFSAAKTGTWSANPALIGPFAISLKGGTGFTVYLFENITQAVTSGTWSTLGILNNGGNQPNLSHISLFKAEVPSTPVPEPITMFGIGVGLAGGGILKQKYGKKANKEKVTA
ncbi:PEP-CTERM sorting domain-containing protein [Anabaena sp. CCY 9402-a]|uniref:PEP-CTERM sorting domain-containing protein n=1 Tax=Anabaena sp. CCY 9402-a TaxID=3103867 RepID=UPI0039C72E72